MTLPKTLGAIISPLWIFRATFQLRKSECTLSLIDAENLRRTDIYRNMSLGAPDLSCGGSCVVVCLLRNRRCIAAPPRRFKSLEELWDPANIFPSAVVNHNITGVCSILFYCSFGPSLLYQVYYFPASRGLSRREEMYSRRDLCRLPTRCLMKPPTRFLVETDRFFKPVPFNVWCACLVRLYADNYWAYSRLWQTGSVGCVAREKNVTGC